ncbi:MAG: XRE family transcriptional regulator [Opitutaceae bacterium]|jgi:transcriptional regulator with XRE-family HTH domain
MAKSASSVLPKFDFSIIRQLRDQHEMTLADLSKVSKVSIAVISKLERNQTTAELDTLFRLARAFGLSATDLLALCESSLAHRVNETRYHSGKFSFRRVRFANVVGLLGEAPAGATVKRPEIHHDDTEVCWIIGGRLRLALPHESFDLGEGMSVQFDAILEHTYEALDDCRFIILHLRKDKRY